MKLSQTLDFGFGFMGLNGDGRYTCGYSNYDFEPNFSKRSFSNQVLSFEPKANKKDSLYWEEKRPVPLTNIESNDYLKKDSIQVIRKSRKYLDSIDHKNNKFNLLSPITGYTYRNSYEKWSLSFNSPLESIAYNTVQGWNASTSLNYFKQLNDKGKWISAGVDVNYGISEDKIRPVFYFSKKWNNLERPRFSISGGITTRQFNGRNPISRLNNTVYSLFRKENYLKILKTYMQPKVQEKDTNYSLEYFLEKRQISSIQQNICCVCRMVTGERKQS